MRMLGRTLALPPDCDSPRFRLQAEPGFSLLLYCSYIISRDKCLVLTFPEYFSYNIGMKKTRGRPPKEESDRKATDLRIPVTADQKVTITMAALSQGQDMAAWARQLLVRAAQDALANVKNGR